MSNLPKPINGTKKPPRPGVYLVVLQNAQGQHGGCYLWDGECWRGWVTMFDPPEWDPAEMHNCQVIDWMNPDDAMREICRHRKTSEQARKEIAEVVCWMSGEEPQWDYDECCARLGRLREALHALGG